MYKLVIMILKQGIGPQYTRLWPQFLHHAERMPGLQRESTTQVQETLIGMYPVYLIHELFFNSLKDLQKAMASPDGKEAGRLLQEITNGQLSLLIAEHKEDTIENLRKYQKQTEDE